MQEATTPEDLATVTTPAAPEAVSGVEADPSATSLAVILHPTSSAAGAAANPYNTVDATASAETHTDPPVWLWNDAQLYLQMGFTADEVRVAIKKARAQTHLVDDAARIARILDILSAPKLQEAQIVKSSHDGSDADDEDNRLPAHKLVSHQGGLVRRMRTRHEQASELAQVTSHTPLRLGSHVHSKRASGDREPASHQAAEETALWRHHAEYRYDSDEEGDGGPYRKGLSALSRAEANLSGEDGEEDTPVLVEGHSPTSESTFEMVERPTAGGLVGSILDVSTEVAVSLMEDEQSDSLCDTYPTSEHHSPTLEQELEDAMRQIDDVTINAQHLPHFSSISPNSTDDVPPVTEDIPKVADEVTEASDRVSSSCHNSDSLSEKHRPKEIVPKINVEQTLSSPVNAQGTSSADGARPRKRRILIEFVRLFAQMQALNVAEISTKQLSDVLFGWSGGKSTASGNSSYIQHDVHELNRILFDALELSLKGTNQADLITKLYSGTTISYTACGSCQSTRVRKYRDSH